MIITTFNFSFQGYPAYNLFLFELSPAYTCQEPSDSSSPWFSCNYDQVKSGELLSRIDYSDPTSLDNWETRYQLRSKPSWMTGMIGSMFFVGYFIGSLVPRFADIYGRKPFIVFGSIVQGIAGILLALSTNVYTISANYLIIGICAPLLCSIGYNHTMELIPSKDSSLSNGVLMSFDALGSLFGMLYFRFMDINMDYFLYATSATAIIFGILTLYLPESP